MIHHQQALKSLATNAPTTRRVSSVTLFCYQIAVFLWCWCIECCWLLLLLILLAIAPLLVAKPPPPPMLVVHSRRMLVASTTPSNTSHPLLTSWSTTSTLSFFQLFCATWKLARLCFWSKQWEFLVLRTRKTQILVGGVLYSFCSSAWHIQLVDQEKDKQDSKIDQSLDEKWVVLPIIIGLWGQRIDSRTHLAWNGIHQSGKAFRQAKIGCALPLGRRTYLLSYPAGTTGFGA